MRLKTLRPAVYSWPFSMVKNATKKVVIDLEIIAINVGADSISALSAKAIKNAYVAGQIWNLPLH